MLSTPQDGSRIVLWWSKLWGMSTRFTCRILGVLVLSLAGCGSPEGGDEEPILTIYQEVKAPLAEAYCTIKVDGVGNVPTETDYLPHVVQCENGGANLQALKAQAIAARSVAYYAMATNGSICNGQGCQVYSCGNTPTAAQRQAVEETSGIYLSYDAMLTYGFYVAGDSNASPPSCKGSSGSTEKWVTYNEGKTGADVKQTALGYVSNPIFGQNRGCMSQWGARCLENHNGYDYLGILRFFYGADIGLLTAPGSCVKPTVPELDMAWVDWGSDAQKVGENTYRVCAGSTFHFWMEAENKGSAAWKDEGGSASGTAVRLGVPGDAVDPLVGTNRISLNDNDNNEVRSDGGDCNDAPKCRRTRFTSGAGIEATAPLTPGEVETKWQLVDEGREFFGSPVSMTFEVEACDDPGVGGSAGSAGSAGMGQVDKEAGVEPDANPGAGGNSDYASSYSSQEAEGCACGVVGQPRMRWQALLFGLACLGWCRRNRTAKSYRC